VITTIIVEEKNIEKNRSNKTAHASEQKNEQIEEKP
jgi:hypothetical protein